MLHDLPHFQLGPPDDVFSLGFYGRILCAVAGGNCNFRVACLGIVRNDLSRTFLGDNESFFKVLRMHGQTLYAVLSETKKMKLHESEIVL